MGREGGQRLKNSFSYHYSLAPIRCQALSLVLVLEELIGCMTEGTFLAEVTASGGGGQGESRTLR